MGTVMGTVMDMDMASRKAIEMNGYAKYILPGLLAAGIAFSASQISSAEAEDGTGGAPKRAWTIEPRISLTETFTDHANVGQSNKESDLITQVSPGVRIKGDTARMKFNADYSLRGVMYANNGDENEIQHALNAFGTLEAVEDWLFVDVNGVVTQQLISAFGTQSPDDSSINANTTQTSNFRVSPYIKGKLGGFADYQARYSRSFAQASASSNYDTDIEDWSGSLRGDTALAKLGWSLDGSLQRYDYGNGRESESDRLRGFLTYRYDPQLSFSVNAGRESNDFGSAGSESYTSHGFGFNWRPTQRTDISFLREKRFFGSGHSFKFKHRMKRTAIQFSDSRDVSGLPDRLTAVGLGTYYDLFYDLLASSGLEDAERAALTESLLSQYGIPADAVVVGNFLTSQVTLQRRQELSLLLSGVRNTVTLAVRRSQSERLSSIPLLGDDFENYTEITQQGLSVNWSHRLTPLSTLGATVSYSKSSGTTTAAGEDDSTQKQLSVTYSTKLGTRTSASLSVRRSQFDSSAATANDYTENAVVGAISMQF